MDDDRVNDPSRLRAIRRSELAPNMGDPSLDRHVRLAKASLGADTVLFSVVDADRQFFPTFSGLDQPWSEECATPLSHSFCKHVVRTEAPFIVDDAVRDLRVADNLAQTELNVGSYAGVPVRDPDGQILGSFCVIDATPRDWSNEEVAILRDIADSLETEIAIRSDRRELEDRVASGVVAQETEEAVKSVAKAANQAQTTRAVADELARRVGPAVGASITSIAIIAGDELRCIRRLVAPEMIGGDRTVVDSDQTVSISLADDHPMSRAARTGRPVHVVGSSGLGDDHLLMAAETMGDLSSFRAVPVHESTGEVRAVIGMGWAEPMADQDVPRVIDQIVDVAAAALERAARYEAERAQAEVLERLVLPVSLPRSEGYHLAASYIAPHVTQRVGGDIYDVVVREDGAVGVLVADAVGHDVIATRAVARLRHAVGVLMLEGRSPGEIMHSVSRYVNASPNRRNVTCVIMLFEGDGSAVTIANAGHPPPLMRRGSQVEAVGPVGEPLLGRAVHEYRERRVDLDDVSVVLAYTDGLIDRRDQTFGESESWLRDFLRTATDTSGPHIVRALSDAAAEWQAEDDVVVLTVAPRAVEAEVLMQTTAGALVLSDMRLRLSNWAASVGATVLLSDLSLVATELLTNAREAVGDDEVISLAAHRAGGVITLAVTQPGSRFEIERTMPPASSERGRGLALATAVAHSLSVTSSKGTVTVNAEFILDEEQASS